MRFRTLWLVLGLWLAAPPHGLADSELTAVTVMPFTAAEGGGEAWLGKGIADLLMRDLAEADAIAVLERDRLQVYLQEMELQSSGFFDQSMALRVGEVARVDEVIYGNYRLQRDRLTINLLAVDLDTHELITLEQVAGGLADLRQLARRLALAYLEHRKVPLTERERANIDFAPTDSLTATEHFYRAVDHYDHGAYARAFGELYAAARQDSQYFEARLWMGRMLEALGQRSLAVTAYLGLHRDASNRVEGHDALLMAARLLRDESPDQAVSAYRRLATLTPPVPHSLFAALELGRLHEEQGDRSAAYAAYRRVDAFRAKLAALQPREERAWHDRAPRIPPARIAGRTRSSRYFRWSDALALYREAAVRLAVIFPQLTPDEADPVEPPRGLIPLDPRAPEVRESRYGTIPALFHEQRYTKDWREAFYVLAAPRGYVVTGVDLELSGQLTQVSSQHDYAMRVLDFPLKHNYQNDWLGVIYGQTARPASLSKSIPFYGKPRRQIALQLTENHGLIHGWAVNVHLQAEAPAKESPTPAVVDSTEGAVIGSVPWEEGTSAGVARPAYAHVYEPRHSLALANNYRDGLHLVAARGVPGSESTDLYWSHSADGDEWSEPVPLAINSHSDDYAPRLLRSEDGSLRLFWISNRRGLGWELWTSRLPRGATDWEPARRIPLERFGAHNPRKRGSGALDLLRYAVHQDQSGRWLLVLPAHKRNELVVLSSSDAQEWQLVTRIPDAGHQYSLALTQDRGGVYRLAGIERNGRLHLWHANAPDRWHGQIFAINGYRSAHETAMYPISIFPEADGRMLLLISDLRRGLQYARFAPGGVNPPNLDLVKDTGLEAYAAAALDDGRYLIAAGDGEGVTLRRFQAFRAPLNPENDPAAMIYREAEQDDAGNLWQRIFARYRSILPDVTTVGAAPDGRVWWGIETGIMALKDRDFFMADVADGFFHHYVTSIVPCGRDTYFASRFLDRPVLGVASPDSGPRRYRLRAQAIEGLHGSISALACADDKQLVAGTSTGEVIKLTGDRVDQRQKLANDAITAIAVGPRAGQVWVGTASGSIFVGASEFKPLPPPTNALGPVHALAVDGRETLWAGIGDDGLYRFDDPDWSKPTKAQVYHAVGDLEAAPDGGIWIMAHPQTRSKGLAYYDGEGTSLYRPPGRLLEAPTGLAAAEDGGVWIGTAFHGVYKLERARQ